ncbi:MAG TPA: protein kinase [Kofleriaceae bacterium]|nr:protein kinase [Kofleriaceae bacterium]
MARNPTRIGRYDLISALATGGMGRIYLARATGLGGFSRKVVIKTLEVPLTSEADQAVAMFLDEARLVGLLHHQHIASVFEVGRDDDGRHYIVLDYVEGYSAHDVWERAAAMGAALPLDFSLTVVSAAANGLHYTHTRKDDAGTPLGIVHRDVTPSNVMIGHDGAVKLIDFGIAMATSRATKTQTGYVKGKVGYLSPEQVAGRDVDPRTDVFALGILLYELTTLQRAFRDSSDLATMQRIKQGKVVRPSQLVGEYPAELEAIVMRALQVDPRDRFNDADAMRRAVEALGHRMRFVLGDAAVIEVMAQLFEAGASSNRPASLDDDPALEWAPSEHDLTVRRDPKELLEAMRAAEAAQPPDPPPRPVAQRRKLRAATEAADALIVMAADASSSSSMTAVALQAVDLSVQTPRPVAPGAALPATPRARPSASSFDIEIETPPGTPALPPKPAAKSSDKPSAKPSAKSAAKSSDKPIKPSAKLVPSRSDAPLIGASLMANHRRPRLRWVGVGIAGAAVVAGVAWFVTRSPSKAAAEATPAPVAARIPAPPPPMPAAKEPPPPPAPTTIHVRIVSHPADATVLLDGKKLGHTPLDETVPVDPGKHVVKLRHRGYLTQSIDVTLDADLTQELTLSPQK